MAGGEGHAGNGGFGRYAGLQVRIAQADCPKPIELSWKAPRPVLSMMFMARS